MLLNRSLLIGLMAFCSIAQAYDGTFSISGGLVGKTCKINGVKQGDSVVDIPIFLGNVSYSSFPFAGTPGGISIPALGVNLTECTPGSNILLSLDGTGNIDIGTNSYKNLIPLDGGGTTNLGVQILNTKTQLVLSPTGSNGLLLTADGAGNAVAPIGARFYSISLGVTPGTFSTVGGFNLTYP